MTAGSSENDLSSIPTIDEVFLEQKFSTRYKVLMITLGSLASTYCGIWMISPAFYRFTVPYTCSDQGGNMSPVSTETVHTSLDQQATCDISDTCSAWAFNYSTIDRKTSIQQSFELVCDDEIYLKLHGSMYFLGMCFGSVLGGYLSDRMGRKKFFQLSCIFGISLSIWMAFSESLIVHLICFCAVSAFELGAVISMFALVVEAGSANSRFAASLLSGLSFTVGVPLCAPLAMIFENWRHLVLAISCLIFLGLFVSLFIDESPRWLWAEGRYEEVFDSVKKAYRLKNESVPPETKKVFAALILKGNDKKGMISSITRDFKNVFGLPWFKGAENNEKKYSKEENPQFSTKSIWLIWKYPTLCVRLVILTLHWICVNSLYYGLTFGAEMLEQNIYIFVVTQGLSGLVGNISGFIFLKYFGRKTIAVAALAFSASCYLACAFISLSNVAVILAITFSARAALELFFILCYLWTADLMPTVIRTSALGFASLVARIFGLALPFVDYLERIHNSGPLLFFAVFGYAVLMSTFLLPESKGQQLPNSLEEGNNFGRKKSQNKLEILRTKMDCVSGTEV